MICPNCQTEFDGDSCPTCGMQIRRVRAGRGQTGESGPQMVSTKIALRLAWEALKTTYFVMGLIFLGLLLVIVLVFLVGWCAGGS